MQMSELVNSRIEANLRHITKFEAKPNPKPLAYTTVTRGFEKVAFTKIVRELRDDNLIVKQKSLLAARELLGSPINYVQCIAAGITPAVISLLKDDDAVVRERAAGTMEYLAVKEVGSRDIIQYGGVAMLVQQLQDPVTAVRDAAYKALIEAARFDCTRNALVELKKALPLLMKLVLEENHSRSLHGLNLLNACVQTRQNDQALMQLVDKASAIPLLSELIDADKPLDIQEQSAQLLGLLTSNFNDAKLEAVQVKCIPKLLALMTQGHTMLASAAATATMMITVAKEGKYAALETTDGLQALASLLDPQHEQLCINVMECICNIAEAPESRPVLAECGAIQRLVEIHQSAAASELVKRSAAQALRQCNFKNWPFQPLPGATLDTITAEAQQEAPPDMQA